MPFYCQICKKPFNEKGNLKTHYRIHTGEKPYVCSFPECKQAFKALGHLKDHLKIHYNIKPFECNICTAKFSRKSTLKIHIRTHTGEKPHQCPYKGCNKWFSEKGNMKTHYKTHIKSYKFDYNVDIEITNLQGFSIGADNFGKNLTNSTTTSNEKKIVFLPENFSENSLSSCGNSNNNSKNESIKSCSQNLADEKLRQENEFLLSLLYQTAMNSKTNQNSHENSEFASKLFSFYSQNMWQNNVNVNTSQNLGKLLNLLRFNNPVNTNFDPISALKYLQGIYGNTISQQGSVNTNQGSSMNMNTLLSLLSMNSNFSQTQLSNLNNPLLAVGAMKGFNL